MERILQTVVYTHILISSSTHIHHNLRKEQLMKPVLSTALLLLFAGSIAVAQEKQTTGSEQSALVASTIIKVESIQCGSCVRTVEKALKALNGVESAKVNLKKKTASVTYKPGEVTLAKLEEAITKSGYSANDKKADPTAYEKLDECCKIAEE